MDFLLSYSYKIYWYLQVQATSFKLKYWFNHYNWKQQTTSSYVSLISHCRRLCLTSSLQFLDFSSLTIEKILLERLMPVAPLPEQTTAFK